MHLLEKCTWGQYFLHLSSPTLPLLLLNSYRHHLYMVHLSAVRKPPGHQLKHLLVSPLLTSYSLPRLHHVPVNPWIQLQACWRFPNLDSLPVSFCEASWEHKLVVDVFFICLRRVNSDIGNWIFRPMLGMTWIQINWMPGVMAIFISNTLPSWNPVKECS